MKASLVIIFLILTSLLHADDKPAVFKGVTYSPQKLAALDKNTELWSIHLAPVLSHGVENPKDFPDQLTFIRRLKRPIPEWLIGEGRGWDVHLTKRADGTFNTIYYQDYATPNHDKNGNLKQLSK